MSKLKAATFGMILVIAAIAIVKWPSPSASQPEQTLSLPKQELPLPESVDRGELRAIIVEDNTDSEILIAPLTSDEQLPPSIDKMAQLFKPYPPTLPFVQTVIYTSKVDWLPGRSAYLGDYASYYKTSKHFLSRSLNGVGEYLSDIISKGDRFNVIRTDHDIEFHLVLDLSRLRMWVYAYDATENSRYLLKDYAVTAGKLSKASSSGSLTPTGVFALGEEIAVYKPGVMGQRHHKTIEMLTVFGQRWIPLAKEIGDCTGPCKGLGIHGMPWQWDAPSNQWVECRDSLGEYASDGCIRLVSEDINELFAVVVSRPTYLHIVRDFSNACLPGAEKLDDLST